MPVNLIKVPTEDIVKIELAIHMSYFEEQTVAGNLIITGNVECVKLIETLNSLESLKTNKDEKIPKRIADKIIEMIDESEREINDKMRDMKELIEIWKKEGDSE